MTLGIFLKCLTFTSKKYYCGTSGEVRTQGFKHKITWKDFHKNKISADLNLNGYNFLNVGKVKSVVCCAMMITFNLERASQAEFNFHGKCRK